MVLIQYDNTNVTKQSFGIGGFDLLPIEMLFVIQAEIPCALPDPSFSFSVREITMIYLDLNCFSIRQKIFLVLSLSFMLNWKPSLFM